MHAELTRTLILEHLVLCEAFFACPLKEIEPEKVLGGVTSAGPCFHRFTPGSFLRTE